MALGTIKPKGFPDDYKFIQSEDPLFQLGLQVQKDFVCFTLGVVTYS